MTTISNSDKDFTKALSFLLMTTVFLIITRDLSVLCHEWAHGVVAWIFHYQRTPFALHNINWSFLNIYSVDPGSLYANLFILGQQYISAKIAIAGPLFSFILMILGALLISNKNILTKPWLSYFLFWFTLNNFGQVFSYIPEHIFSKTGDVAFFLEAYSLSPWILLVPIILVLLFVALKVLIPALSEVLTDLECKQVWLRNIVLLFATALVFFWYGFAAQDYYGFHDLSGLRYPLSVFAGVVIYFVVLMQSPGYLRKDNH
jgi:hypothetical protein